MRLAMQTLREANVRRDCNIEERTYIPNATIQAISLLQILCNRGWVEPILKYSGFFFSRYADIVPGDGDMPDLLLRTILNRFRLYNLLHSLVK